MSDLIEPIDATEAAAAIRGIVRAWRRCTEVAGLSSRSSQAALVSKTPAVIAAQIEAILEAAAFLSQGDDEDRKALAAAVAETLCRK
jgi:hypothetical protein